MNLHDESHSLYSKGLKDVTSLLSLNVVADVRYSRSHKASNYGIGCGPTCSRGISFKRRPAYVAVMTPNLTERIVEMRLHERRKDTRRTARVDRLPVHGIGVLVAAK